MSEEVFSIEPIIAWRKWRFTRDGLLGNQASTLFKYVHGPGVNVAVCQHYLIPSLPHFPKPHQTPHPDCSCGFYGQPLDVFEQGISPAPVYIHGSVWLWGRVEEHEYGWRAEKSKVRSLLVENSGVATILHSNYPEAQIAVAPFGGRLWKEWDTAIHISEIRTGLLEMEASLAV